MDSHSTSRSTRTTRRVRSPARSGAAERRRARQQEASRSDILESAARAFARSGYRASTMQQIAAEAGFTAASLYTYFDSKEAILEALLQSVLEELHATFGAACPEATLDARLTALLRRQYEVAERRRAAMAFFERFSVGAEELPARLADELTKRGECPFTRATADWFARNSKPAELGRSSTDDAAMVLRGISQAFVRRWLRDPRGGLVRQAPVVVRYTLKGLQGRKS